MKKQFMKLVALALCVVMVVSVIAIPTFAKTAEVWDGTVAEGFAAGSGTEKDPYQIATAEELAYLSSLANSKSYGLSDLYFVLVNDIYLNDITNYGNWTASTAGLNEWTPISHTNKFLSTFDGQGHTVYGMYITNGGYKSTGLFGNVTNDKAGDYGTGKGVYNLNVACSYIDVTVTYGDMAEIGGVAGRLYSGAVIVGCTSDAIIKVNDNGKATRIGGIVGAAREGHYSIEDCAFKGSIDVTASNNNTSVAGIVGFASDTYEMANRSGVHGCYNEGNITMSNGKAAGGILGYASHTSGKGALIVEDCYNTGKIDATATISGAAGIVAFAYCHLTVKNVFNVGEIVKANNAKELIAETYKGGSGQYTWTYVFENLYYNTDSKLAAGFAAVNDVAVGLSVKEGTFVSDNMAFGGFTGYDVDIWQVEAGRMPVLKALPAEVTSYDATAPVWDGSVATAFAGGTGTEDDPYQIATGAQLAYLENLILNQTSGYTKAYYKLTADIYLNDISGFDTWTKDTKGLNLWLPIGRKGSKPFKGSFDGDGHTVYGMYINSVDGSLCGLFGRLEGTTAVVENVNIAYSLITGSLDDTVGSVVAYARGGAVVKNCASSAKIDITLSNSNGWQSVGGVVGVVGDATQVGAQMYNCANYGDITIKEGSYIKGNFVGGVAGQMLDSQNTTLVSGCYNEGSINAYCRGVGGVVGCVYEASGALTVKDCINAGDVTGFGSYASSSGDTVNCKTGGIVGETASKHHIVNNCINLGAVANTTLPTGAGQLSGTENSLGAYENCFYNSDNDIAVGGNGADGKALSVAKGEFVAENMFGSVWTVADGKLPTLTGVGFDSDIEILGAQIRESWTEFYKNGEKVAEGQGIRFGATISDASKYTENGEYSLAVIISTKKSLGDSALTVVNAQYVIKAVNTVEYNTETDELTFSGHLVGIDAVNFDTVFTARAVVMKGDKVVMYSDVMERSVSGVAESLGYTLDSNGSLCLQHS